MDPPGPTPPYVAVIFTSTRTEDDPERYEDVAEQMLELASCRPGFLGFESARDPVTRMGISVSYWISEVHAREWKQVAEHQVAQQQGRERWYEGYEIHVATVSRSYRWSRPGVEDA